MGIEHETDERTSPPLSLLAGASLFLDLDGTLLDLVDQPDEVAADEALISLLGRLAARLDGRLAVISGRSLAQIDEILGASVGMLALSGSHGLEHRLDGIATSPGRPAALDEAAKRMRGFVASWPGALVEDKSLGVALHYRMARGAAEQADALAQDIADELGLAVQRGKMMVELRAPGGDKGEAIATMMRAPAMAETVPVFVGDDLTDEPGFAAAEALGGCGVLVGADRPSAARYRLASPAAVRDWLSHAAEAVAAS
jgi:trehalose 6-phosphate phosphatase